MLDVATGGARISYGTSWKARLRFPACRSPLSIRTARPSPTAGTRSLVEWAGRVRFIDAPIRQLSSKLGSDEFDVIISAGLFDYLDDTSARDLLTLVLTNRLSPEGVIAISNFHPDDPSRLVKTWLVDWPLIYRTEDDCGFQLFPRVDSGYPRTALLTAHSSWRAGRTSRSHVSCAGQPVPASVFHARLPTPGRPPARSRCPD